ncbi:hypothetical protein E4P82_15115 [Candidatus Competibacter phosphatis]|uniref:Uncharacterized protein n=1 Tax=Candidatus Competibacter phosphatis TaxID=221280 RepID=A0ABX1TM00_9GAMM|nr:hypothetical protein [Candidatus Competibacter phosphatis]
MLMRSSILYISYDGILEPLGQSQVLRYLERPCGEVKVISEDSHTMQAGRIRISHLGNSGWRSNRASTACMASLEREIPFS